MGFPFLISDDSIGRLLPFFLVLSVSFVIFRILPLLAFQCDSPIAFFLFFFAYVASHIRHCTTLTYTTMSTRRCGCLFSSCAKCDIRCARGALTVFNNDAYLPSIRLSFVPTDAVYYQLLLYRIMHVVPRVREILGAHLSVPDFFALDDRFIRESDAYFFHGVKTIYCIATYSIVVEALISLLPSRLYWKRISSCKSPRLLLDLLGVLCSSVHHSMAIAFCRVVESKQTSVGMSQFCRFLHRAMY